jgi:hypothetical protein
VTVMLLLPSSASGAEQPVIVGLLNYICFRKEDSGLWSDEKRWRTRTHTFVNLVHGSR